MTKPCSVWRRWGMNSSPQAALCMSSCFLIFLNCHLLNCSTTALARAQITTFIAESHLNPECTCKLSVQHSWALWPAVDGGNEKWRMFHLITCISLTIQLAESKWWLELSVRLSGLEIDMFLSMTICNRSKGIYCACDSSKHVFF